MKFELYFEKPQQPQLLMNYNKKPDIFYKELINDNICKCDTIQLHYIPHRSKEIDTYLLKSVEYRLTNIIPNKVKYNIANQKKTDMSIILNIYKNYLIDNEIDSQNFLEYYVSTIGIDFNIKSFVVNDRKVKLQIWDSCDQERFNALIIETQMRLLYVTIFRVINHLKMQKFGLKNLKNILSTVQLLNF